MGGTLKPIEAGGIAGTGIGASFAQISSSSGTAPPPPPETFGAYTKKTEKGNGVIAMIDLLVADLDKELQTATVNEKEAQREYETALQIPSRSLRRARRRQRPKRPCRTSRTRGVRPR